MPEQNLFTLICAEVCSSQLSELYLLAGETLEIPGASPHLLQAIQNALNASGNNPVETLMRAFHYAPGVTVPTFADGLKSLISTEAGSVEFHVRKIGNSPITFRVQFARVDEALQRPGHTALI